MCLLLALPCICAISDWKSVGFLQIRYRVIFSNRGFLIDNRITLKKKSKSKIFDHVYIHMNGVPISLSLATGPDSHLL